MLWRGVEHPSDAAPLVADLILRSTKLAEETAHYARAAELAKVGKSWDDDDFTMAVERCDTNEVEVSYQPTATWSARAGRPRGVRVWADHLDRMIALYSGHGEDNRLVSRVFSVLQIYDTLS